MGLWVYPQSNFNKGLNSGGITDSDPKIFGVRWTSLGFQRLHWDAGEQSKCEVLKGSSRRKCFLLLWLLDKLLTQFCVRAVRNAQVTNTCLMVYLVFFHVIQVLGIFFAVCRDFEILASVFCNFLAHDVGVPWATFHTRWVLKLSNAI